MTGGIIILIGCKTPLFKLVFVSRPSVSLTPDSLSDVLLCSSCSFVLHRRLLLVRSRHHPGLLQPFHPRQYQVSTPAEYDVSRHVFRCACLFKIPDLSLSCPPDICMSPARCWWIVMCMFVFTFSALTYCDSSFCRYEFGSAIFIAWAGAFLAVVGGGMLAASCPRGKPSPKYPISRPPSSKEYVWTGQDSVFGGWRNTLTFMLVLLRDWSIENMYPRRRLVPVFIIFYCMF